MSTRSWKVGVIVKRQIIINTNILVPFTAMTFHKGLNDVCVGSSSKYFVAWLEKLKAGIKL